MEGGMWFLVGQVIVGAQYNTAWLVLVVFYLFFIIGQWALYPNFIWLRISSCDNALLLTVLFDVQLMLYLHICLMYYSVPDIQILLQQEDKAI